MAYTLIPHGLISVPSQGPGTVTAWDVASDSNLSASWDYGTPYNVSPYGFAAYPGLSGWYVGAGGSNVAQYKDPLPVWESGKVKKWRLQMEVHFGGVYLLPFSSCGMGFGARMGTYANDQLSALNKYLWLTASHGGPTTITLGVSARGSGLSSDTTIISQAYTPADIQEFTLVGCDIQTENSSGGWKAICQLWVGDPDNVLVSAEQEFTSYEMGDAFFVWDRRYMGDTNWTDNVQILQDTSDLLPPKGPGSTGKDPNPQATRVLSATKLQLPRPPRVYSEQDQSQTRRLIERFLTQLGAAAQGSQDQLDGAVEYLNDLLDVAASSPSNGDFLRYDGTQWENATAALDDLSDVTITSPADRAVLLYDTSSAQWVDGTVSYDDLDDLPTLVTTLSALSDVAITSPTDGATLVYNTATQKWEDGTPASSVTTLDDLDDVTLTAPTTGDLLQYDGAEWVNIPVDTSVHARETSVITTTSLDDLDSEDGSLDIGTGLGFLVRAEANEPCWLRIYASTASQALDSGRAYGTLPPSGQGILADLDFTTTGQVIEVAPVEGLSNLDDPDMTVVYWSVQNRSGTTESLEIDLDIVPLQDVAGIGSTPEPSITTLTALDDVDVTAPSDGDVLTYDSGSGKWENATVSGGYTPPTAPYGTPHHWYRIDSLSALSDTDPVTTWEDEGSLGEDLGNAGGTVSPLYRVEGTEEFIRFDGSNDYLYTTTATNYTGTALTLFVVGRAHASPSNGGYCSLSKAGVQDWNNSGSIAYTGYTYMGRPRIEQSGGGGNLNPPVTISAGSTWCAGAARFSPAGGLYASAQTHNFDQWGNCLAAVGTGKTFDYTHIVTGARWTGALSNYGPYDVCEIIIYHSALTDAQVRETLEYLRYKYPGLGR